MSAASQLFAPGQAPDPDGVLVRRASLVDVSPLALLFGEMQRHYGQPVSADRAVDAAALACRPVVGDFDPRTLLALIDGAVVGSVVLNVTFPAAELARSLYIRDLYVSAVARRRGIGRALVRAAARLTLQEGFCALDWTTDAANLGAREMYEGEGARRIERIYYRLAGADLRDLAH
ncbi:GNAT family N-acetyltransferase [Roseomonas sp. OT10]|uniref:GNAT family N-acetyltransferase n=1 Tax=Roseomonas cutis TaxID=2897332 RepID=UPI001E3B39CF|nr:GNAT family N-acetyltransferase [Roseomonas sp. OT10]UFN51198.1 GNAT family N-acetyltransferase [Roseomonas sp. OT10]